MKKIFKLILILFLSFSLNIYAQIKDPLKPTIKNNLIDGDNDRTPKSLQNLNNAINKIEKGFLTGQVKEFENLLNTKIYINLQDKQNGYYSTNQTYYILNSFFESFKTESFKIENKALNLKRPYITGILKYKIKDIDGALQVYISLVNLNGEWKMIKINITDY